MRTDQSCPIGRNADERVQKGTPRQLLECSRKPGSKILNGLHFPLPLAGLDRTTFASEIHALHETLNCIGWKPGMPTYNSEFRWAIIAIMGAFHGFHIDSDGSGSFLEGIYGAKLWMLSRPAPGKQEIADFSNINTFLQERFDFDNIPEGWIIEAVILKPGTKL